MITDQCVKNREQRVAQATKLIDSLGDWAMDEKTAPVGTGAL